MAGLVIGAFMIAAGVTLAVAGGRRLRRPRRAEDVRWAGHHPFFDQLLGGLTIFGLRGWGFDRVGALWSVGAGALAIVLGTIVLASG